MIKRRMAIAVVGVLACLTPLLAVGVAPASASPWDPHVRVQGRATCSPNLGQKVTWMWYEASNGERGWATLLDSATLTRRYSFDLWKVGTGGTQVTVKWGCSSEARTTFGVNRPTAGATATRNLCPQWWGPSACLI